MRNLAHENPSPEMIASVNLTVKAELQEAGIRLMRLTKVPNREVPSLWIGRIQGWEFIRAWGYWVARGKMPMEWATAIHHDPKAEAIRAGGHAGRIAPGERGVGAVDGNVTLYHIDSQDGLNLFVDYVKRLNAGERPTRTK